MSKIWSVLDIGKRSLMNAQTGLQTVSHNIANKTTDGYSRQRVELQSNVPVGHGNKRIGMGARTGAVTRTNNSYLEKQITNEGNTLGYNDAKSQVLGRVEQVFNEQVNDGLNKFMGDMFNSFRELSNNPESLASRTLVKESADFLAKDFHRVSRQLKDIQKDVDYQLATHVSEVNEITKEIANLNEKIQTVTVSGGPANDERDRRDLLVKKLSEKINVQYAESNTGLLTVTAGNSAILVSGYDQHDLFVSGTVEGKNKQEGNFEIFFKPNKKGTAINVTRQITKGAIGGLLETRDMKINKYLSDMDDLAYTLGSKMNEVHSLGYDRYNAKSGNFFTGLNGKKGAAQNINVSERILNDVGTIGAAAVKNSPGDNRVANLISSLQQSNLMGGGTNTIDDYYNSVVGEVGSVASRVNSEFTSQSNIVKQLKNIRESISGVSLDEETTKMIEFQKSFDASARLIRTADEMMDTVLSIKR
ncbi:MAG: flagellar hook-associated protein FlgK [Bdellovibrionaceae bacterium]|jgi:flagellar hook-associated protein 1|nr:flagellar hook-associated protein FlgK [Pseudobdellovibrionaceae bacterium]